MPEIRSRESGRAGVRRPRRSEDEYAASGIDPLDPRAIRGRMEEVPGRLAGVPERLGAMARATMDDSAEGAGRFAEYAGGALRGDLDRVVDLRRGASDVVGGGLYNIGSGFAEGFSGPQPGMMGSAYDPRMSGDEARRMIAERRRFGATVREPQGSRPEAIEPLIQPVREWTGRMTMEERPQYGVGRGYAGGAMTMEETPEQQAAPPQELVDVAESMADQLLADEARAAGQPGGMAQAASPPAWAYGPPSSLAQPGAQRGVMAGAAAQPQRAPVRSVSDRLAEIDALIDAENGGGAAAPAQPPVDPAMNYYPANQPGAIVPPEVGYISGGGPSGVRGAMARAGGERYQRAFESGRAAGVPDEQIREYLEQPRGALLPQNADRVGRMKMGFPWEQGATDTGVIYYDRAGNEFGTGAPLGPETERGLMARARGAEAQRDASDERLFDEAVEQRGRMAMADDPRSQAMMETARLQAEASRSAAVLDTISNAQEIDSERREATMERLLRDSDRRASDIVANNPFITNEMDLYLAAAGEQFFREPEPGAAAGETPEMRAVDERDIESARLAGWSRLALRAIRSPESFEDIPLELRERLWGYTEPGAMNPVVEQRKKDAVMSVLQSPEVGGAIAQALEQLRRRNPEATEADAVEAFWQSTYGVPFPRPRANQTPTE